MYGTTNNGGSGYGTVFEIDANTHALTTLAAFNSTDGAHPYAGLVADASGNLYGTTEGGGASGQGVIFKVAAGTHALSTLATFDGADGALPVGGLIADASGNLYGTTKGGGANQAGTVFELSPTPEPGSLALLGIGGLRLLTRRRR